MEGYRYELRLVSLALAATPEVRAFGAGPDQVSLMCNPLSMIP